MKTVHAPKMVAHLWANQSQPEARNSGKSIFFNGPVLYSYGHHHAIGAFLDDGRVLWNDNKYSPTTAQHSSHAWMALTSEQRTNRIAVPTLKGGMVANLNDLKNTGEFPHLAKECVGEVIRLIETIKGMRSLDKMNATLSQARRYEASGKALCQYVKNGRKVARWPLPKLPDSVPTDKAERIIFVRSIAKKLMLENYTEALVKYDALFNRISGMVSEKMKRVDHYRVQNLSSDGANMLNHLDCASSAYRAATGKAFPGEQHRRAECNELLTSLVNYTIAFNQTYAEGSLRSLLFIFLEVMRARDKGARQVFFAGDRAPIYYEQMIEHVCSLPEEKRNLYAGLVQRINRAMGWRESYLEMLGAHDAVNMGVKNVEDGKFAHALNWFHSATKKLDDATSRQSSFYAKFCVGIDDMRATIKKELPELEAWAKEQSRTLIARWIAGETSENVPSHFGTFARIKGNEVETTLGATVPLVHACRLARIARRVISMGGKKWDKGTGPMVGSFRVNSIDADGSCVIGCHEFSANESQRLLALLETACVDCPDDGNTE